MKNKSLWKVIVQDSRGLPQETRTAIEHLANTKNVIAIIAVTGTAEALEAAREAESESASDFNHFKKKGYHLAVNMFSSIF